MTVICGFGRRYAVISAALDSLIPICPACRVGLFASNLERISGHVRGLCAAPSAARHPTSTHPIQPRHTRRSVVSSGLVLLKGPRLVPRPAGSTAGWRQESGGPRGERGRTAPSEPRWSL